jgi:methyl-accepting chemotaxis protein
MCKYKNYTSDALHTALVYIRNKHLSVANASKLFAIPPRTLYQRLHKETSKVVSIIPSSSITTPSSYWTCTTSGRRWSSDLILIPEVILKEEVENDIEEVENDIEEVENDIEEVENDIKEVKNDIKEVKNDIEEVENDIEEVEKENCDTTEMFRRKLLFHLALSSSQLKHLH